MLDDEAWVDLLPGWVSGHDPVVHRTPLAPPIHRARGNLEEPERATNDFRVRAGPEQALQTKNASVLFPGKGERGLECGMNFHAFIIPEESLLASCGGAIRTAAGTAADPVRCLRS